MEVVNTRPAASPELRGLRGGDLCTFPDLNSPTAAIFSHYTGPAGPAPGTAAWHRHQFHFFCMIQQNCVDIINLRRAEDRAEQTII